MKQFKEFIAKGRLVFVGLEDSKVNWKLCVRCDDYIIHETSMPAKYAVLRSYLLNNYPDCKIKLIYEAGFRGFNLYDNLTEDNIECVVTPPNKVTEEKCNKQKCDKIDAKRLAKVLETNDYKACYVPDKERREDRQVSRTLVCIQKDITRVKNRIRKFLEFHGFDENFKPGPWNDVDYQNLKDLVFSDMVQFNLNIMLNQLDELLKHKTILTNMLKELSAKPRYNKIFNIFQSAPGIGWFTAIRLVLEWGEDLSRFKSSKHFGSFLGLTSSEHSSGETIRHGRITKQSHYYVRAWIIQCAWVAYKRDPALLEKFQNVWKNSGNKKKAIVAVARKLCVRLRICALTNREYCYGQIK